jgi:hypothetical protein
MRKASTGMPAQGTQAPSAAPDLIPAETENQPRTHTEIGTVKRGTSQSGRTVDYLRGIAPGKRGPLYW